LSGIYIHIPYCKQACHYCDFHFSTNLKTQPELVNCLIEEVKLQKEFLSTQKLNTLYFGGGTPSILTENELAGIFEVLNNLYDYEGAEITFEANPDDLSLEKLKIIKSFGINRLSIGTQSFDDKILKYFNRSHNANQAVEAIKMAQDQGLDNISLDLIYGIPNQSLEDFKIDIEKALELDTKHISAYCLTIEPKTVFGKWHEENKLTPVDEGLAAEQFQLLIETLEASGFQHYEISNFAKAGFESQHNSNYWFGDFYLGIGPGAHSFNGNQRHYNISNNIKYIQSIKKQTIPATIEVLSLKQKFNEFLLTRIRTSRGVDLIEMSDKLGMSLLKESKNKIDLYLKQELILIDKNVLKLSEKGKLFADKITEDLMI
jgi:oxygen-independent coproporphyrinogen-3 oxidase